MTRAAIIATWLLIGLPSHVAYADPPQSPTPADQETSEAAPPVNAAPQSPSPVLTLLPGPDASDTLTPPASKVSAATDDAAIEPEYDEDRPQMTSEPDAPDDPNDRPVTGTLRGGVYADSDRTVVLRALGAVSRSWEHWLLNGSVGVDSVTSASVDVRSSPALSKVDVITSASGRSSTSGGEMTDTRFQATGGAGWKSSAGDALNLTAAVAKERDYASISGGLNGSVDVLDRTTTLLGGVTLTDNWVSSVLDKSLHRKMFSPGWTAGVAYVLTPDDALRVRYDGKASEGYLSSPYRNVRFGDWTAHLGSQQITFMNTIGSSDGLPERLPTSRISHALVLEWLHALALGIGVHPELRVSRDTWSINSLSAGLDLRVSANKWRLQTGYRFYLQSHANFFKDKYTEASTMYEYYTSDKELGDEVGHLLRLDLAFVLSEPHAAYDSRALLNFQVEGAHYRYPGFVLLPARDGVFAGLGLTWEL